MSAIVGKARTFNITLEITKSIDPIFFTQNALISLGYTHFATMAIQKFKPARSEM